MSARNVAARWPDVETLQAWSLSLAVLDAIVCPEWEYRYFSFDPAWADDEQMASMRNGSGDSYKIVFARDGAIAFGFDHESSLSPWAQQDRQVVTGLLSHVPAVFGAQLTEPAFATKDVLDATVVIWRLPDDDEWTAGRTTVRELEDDDDGADWLFQELNGSAETYAAFAADYYERAVPLHAIEHVMTMQPITNEIARLLNPDDDLDEVRREITGMGYPTAD